MPLTYKAKQKRRGESTREAMGGDLNRPSTDFGKSKTTRGTKGNDAYGPDRASGVQVRKALQTINNDRKLWRQNIATAQQRVPDFVLKKLKQDYYTPALSLLDQMEKRLQDPSILRNETTFSNAMDLTKRDRGTFIQLMDDARVEQKTAMENAEKAKKMGKKPLTSNDLTEKQKKKNGIRGSYRS